MNNNHTGGRSLAILLTICAPLSQAAVEDPFFDMPVVLSASRLEQPIAETPVAVTSIDRELIEASGARNIPDVLRLVPGMIVGYSANEWGEEAKIVVSYHGHTDQFSRRMQVLIDGRSIYEPLLGGVAWNMLPINVDDIERIEVVRGPNASTYGSNSFLGVVNIITRHAAEDPGHFVKANAGNHDIRDLTYRFGGNEGSLDYRVTLSTQNDDGQDARRNVSVYDANGDVVTHLYSAEEVENHDDANADAVDYRLDYQIDNRNQLTYQGGYSRTLIDINENFAEAGIKPVRESDTVNAHQFIKLESVQDTKNTFVLQYYYNLQDKTDFSISKPVDPGVDVFTLDLDFGLRSERHNLELTHFYRATDNLKLIWGLSSQVDFAESPWWLSDGSKIRRELYRAFGNAEWHLNRSNILHLGLLIEHYTTTRTDNSPRISLIHKLNPKHSIRFGISRATRSPFIVEEYGNSMLSHDLTLGGTPIGFTLVEQQLIPNDSIDNEEILSREIGYYGHFLDNKLAFNVRLFRNSLNELIRAIHNAPVPTDTFDGEADQHINDNSTTTKGVEIELNYEANDSLRMIGTTSYLSIDSEDNPTTGQSAVLEESAPRYTASFMAIKQFSELYSGSMALFYVDDMSWFDAKRVGSNNYSTMDIRVTRKLLTVGNSAKVSLVLKNLLDEYSNYDPNPNDGPLVEQNLTGYVELAMQFR